MKKLLSFLFLSVILVSAIAQIPNGYYNGTSGLKGNDLKLKLREIITNGHRQNSYNDLFNYYKSTDNYGNNRVWDMYSIKADGTADYWYYYSKKTNNSSKSGEGEGFNREHSVPQSWFDKKLPMKADLFIVYPTDKYVNNRRGSFPYGETDSPTWTSTNGSKLGPCSFQGYTGTVFEPIDKYKGDFARTYFYTVTRYDVSNWTGESFSGDGLSNWALKLFLKWNDEDPVSQKEIDRNDSVYKIQGNRNPYIDHPEWVHCVFENKCNSIINPSNFSADAVSASEIDLSWTANADNDSILLAYNTSASFGQVSGEYSAGDNISGGGTVLIVGKNITSFKHTGLSPQIYYYKIWSKHNGKYSYGEIKQASPFLPEPSNYPTNFVASSTTSSTISLSWTDATGSILPSMYLIKADVSGNTITPPVDGTPETESQLTKNIEKGIQKVTFSGLKAQTTYHFVIYPYTNTGSHIDYKTDGTAPSVVASTTQAEEYCGNETFDNLSTGSSSYSTVSWTGQDGSTWTATDARTDQNIGSGAAICVRQGYIKSGTLHNGINELTVSTKRTFSGGSGQFSVYVNSKKVGTIPYSDVVQTSTIQNINVPGDIVLKLDKSSNSGDRVIVDNIKWKCYSASSIKNNSENYFKIYPNPNSGIFYISFDDALSENSDIYIYNLQGKIIYSKKLNNNNLKKISVNLSTATNGLYILKVKTEKNIFYKKILINK
jgi:endonuclease I